MILVVGAEGNMGTRYMTILKHLGIPAHGVDLGDPEDEVSLVPSSIDGIIIATPTNCHIANIRAFAKMKKPILCEKPISKDPEEIKALFQEFPSLNLQMVYQYSILAQENCTGISSYNYFKHGGDGLIWDCIQIIGLAKGEIILEETSPEWHCIINGQRLSNSLMDMAYIQFIRKWVAHKLTMTHSDLISIHEKTKLIEEQNG